ncbi:MAG: hypothetical protein ACP6IY_01760 [Promethearchaeia archaeon]
MVRLLKKGKNLLCNYCEVKMNEIFLWQCPNCGYEGQSEVCDNCNSKMEKVVLLQCPECGNMIDEQTLKEKWELKKKIKQLK